MDKGIELEKVDESQTHLNKLAYNLVWNTNLNEENELICHLYLNRIRWDMLMKTGNFD